MKKTKLTRSLLAACSIVALSAVMYGCVHNGGDAPEPMVEPMPDPMEPMPVEVTVDLDVSNEFIQDRLLLVLPDSGTSDTLTIPAGGTATRVDNELYYGVDFTCDSAYPCTVTVTNSLGTIVASMTTQMLPDADEPSATASLSEPDDTFVDLNHGRTESIRDLLGMQDANDSPAVAPILTPTELIGMGIGGPGVLNADMAGLRSDFQANGADLAGHATDADNDAATAAIAAPGASPDLRMGTTITGAMDAIDPSDDMASAPDGWGMKTLFRDWGDTAGDGDGGFETAAIVVKNLGEGTPYPFDRKLMNKYVNQAAKNMFALSIRANGDNPGVTTLGTSVHIGVDEYTPAGGTALPAATSTQWANMVFDSDSLVPAQSQDLLIDVGETFTGTYFGAPGQFQCIAGGADTTSCALARNDDGTVGVNDTDADPDVVASTGSWSFTPDPGAMITVPDQDWMAYGAWLTTPDSAAGDHRLGVFFNGMDPYNPAQNTFLATDAAGLRGSATYSGGATGVYVYGTGSGLFTAEATLTANFDANSNGMDDAGDYSISGRIDNFRSTRGVALGWDTGDEPNRDGLGENDWVVELGRFEFPDAADDNDAATGNPALAIAATGTTGSADGVPWTGSWNGMFFGPNMMDGDPAAPSGVAGQFWAETTDVDTAGGATDADALVNDGLPVTAVVGAFGATMDMDDGS